MKIAEALKLEQLIENELSTILQEKVTIGMTLCGSAKFKVSEGYITYKCRTIDYISYIGDYIYFKEFKETVENYINRNKDKFYRLIWSYEHISELED